MRRGKEVSPLSIKERLELSDPRPSTNKDDFNYLRCRGIGNGGLVSPARKARSPTDGGRDPEDQC